MATIVVPATTLRVASPWGVDGGGGGPTDPTEPEIVDALPISLTSPPDGAVVVTDTPRLIVGVDTDDEDDDAVLTVTVQYADNDTFTGATELSGDFTATDAGVTLVPASVPASTYWRARVHQGEVWRSGWTEPAQFTVDSNINPTIMPVTWQVLDNAARPIHLWHIDPTGPAIGDVVTVYGQGFPSSGQLTFGSTPIVVTSWKRVAATANNQAEIYRQINGDSVTPEHYEVTFTAPKYYGPGEALTVEA